MAEELDDIMSIAADWVDRIDDLSPEDKRELADWLRASPDHGRAFATMHRLTRDGALFDAAMLMADAALPVARRTGGAARRRWQRDAGTQPILTRRRVMAAAVGGAIALPLGFAFIQREEKLAIVRPAVYASLTAKTARSRLPDGSTLTLDAASRISMRFGDDRRLIDLERGGARFDVAHDRNRPFTVHTPMADMTALGTSFTVDRLTNASELRVFEGRVQLDVPGKVPLIITAGQWALVSRTGVQRGSFDPANYSNWQTQWLDADDMRLDYAIDRLARYSPIPIKLADPSLAGRSFSGRFRLDQPEQSLALIGGLFDLNPVHRDGILYLGKGKDGS